MSDHLDPQVPFALIAKDVPKDLHQNIFIVGSLAAAYYHRAQLEFKGVNTKDADVIVTPAGAVMESQAIAERLLAGNWRRKEGCYPSSVETPAEMLRAIRLYPPERDTYFIELLALPDSKQVEKKKWIPLQLSDGWYGLPSFRFLGLTVHDRQRAENGLMYAAPAMMALSNLLSHPEIGTDIMSEQLDNRSILRSAKDLGRVLALVRLSTRDEVEGWLPRWEMALRITFPEECAELAQRIGHGLRALFANDVALEQARHAVSYGLLAGKGVNSEQLKALGEQLLRDVIEPIARRFQK